ncbi:MAG: TonB-dependent receptor [Bacteroidales bacterium]|jgi:iron complex outermembrane receptor protein|nr:TonB-dependent receptor [Bacteroidales bacterium]
MKKILFFLLSVAFSGFLTVNVTGQSLGGKVTDLDGEPLAGASVIVEGTFHGVHTDAGGNYKIDGLKAGNQRIRYSFMGYETQSREINVTGDVREDVRLKPTAIITDDVIISATRAGDQTPLAYSNVTGEILEKQNSGQGIPYLLSLTPSFVETSESGNGIGYTSLRIRGTDASRINVTIDGIPLNDPESQQVFWVDLPDLASSVDNIQVQRGVGTSSNGAGAFGASINIQTKGIENEPFAEINSAAGSFGTFRNSITAGTGLLKDRFAFQMRYSDLRSDGFVDRTGSEHNSAFFSALYRTGKSLLKANVILGTEKTGIGWWGVPKEILEVNRRYNPAGEYTDEEGIARYYDNETDNYTQNHYQFIFSRRMNDYLSLHSALHYTYGKGYYEEYKEDAAYLSYGLPPVSIGDITFGETDIVRRKWMDNDFYGLVYSLNYKRDKLDAKIGGGMNLYSGDHYGRIIWMRYPGTAESNHQWYFNNGEKREASLYGKADYSLSERLSVFGDLQYRFVNYSLRGDDDDLKDIGQSHSYSFFNPKAGLFLRLSSGQEAFLSLSVANREPTRTDFKEAAGDSGATPRPERLYDLEAGYVFRSARSSVGLNLYGMYYRDQLVPTGELSNVGYSIMTNVEKSYRIGAEITAGFKPSEFIGLDMSLTLSSNKIVNFLEHYIDYNTSDWSEEYKSHNLGTVDIAYSPSITGSSDLYANILPPLKVHLISKYVGRQYFDNTMNSERMLDPYFVNNVMIDFEPALKSLRGASFQLLVTNIFNAQYESNAYGGNWYEDGQEKTWAYYFPQAGTGFMLRLGLKF